MIVRTFCAGCLQPYELLLEPTDVDLVKQITDESGATCPCPRLCGGQMSMLGDPTLEMATHGLALKDPIRLTGKKLYQAVNGMGLPDEIPASADIVSMLFDQKITGASMETAGYGSGHTEIYLHEIRFANGMTLHLTAGQRGSKVLKITKARSEDGK